jgi:hypothetical protein
MTVNCSASDLSTHTPLHRVRANIRVAPSGATNHIRR